MFKMGRKIGNTTFYVQVVDDSVKVSSNQSATVEEMFNIADDDDQGYLVLKKNNQ